MGSRCTEALRRGAVAGGVVVVLFTCAVANAQDSNENTAEPSPAPAEPEPAPAAPAAEPSTPPEGTEPSAAPTAPSETAPSDKAPSAEPPAAGAGEPGALPTGFPKTLTPQQRLPENLQGWLQSRRRHALPERPALPAPTNAGPVVPPPTQEPEHAVDEYRRRLKAFEEGGVTVLSNRHAAQAAPVQVIPVAAAVPAPAPAVAERDPEEHSVTETRSLRTNQLQARRVPQEQGLSWRVFAVPVVGISLALLWLRKRRAPG